MTEEVGYPVTDKNLFKCLSNEITSPQSIAEDSDVHMEVERPTFEDHGDDFAKEYKKATFIYLELRGHG